MGIKNTLLDFMKEEAYRPMDIQELVAVFDINEKEYKAFKKTLKTMEKEGLIIKTKKDRYAVPERLGLIIGKLQAHSKGFGFLIPDAEGEKDVFIPSSAINGAMNGDKILVQITREDKNGKKREGEVVQILERGNKKFVGVYEDSRNFGFVVAEDTKINQDIFVSKRDRNGANDGDNNKKTALKYAKEEGWNTPYKALVEGAKKMANSYLKQGQNTKYTFKFDVVGKSFNELYTHQYMTNVQDPTFQAEMLYENYVQNNWLDNELTFIIPIYKNMPTYVKLPSNMEGNLYYVSSNWSGVYLRNGPGGRETNYENIMSVPRDSLVSVLESNINGWAKVDYNGVIGYMSEAFLTPVNKKKDTYKVPQSTELPFNDVGTNDWYYSSIKYTYQKGIIKGATETEFRPNAKFSRGMLVTILWRMEGEPKVTNAKEFADVTSGKYYYNAIKWATSKGIVNGYSNGKFGPEDNITREQLAVMLRNYAKYKGKNVSQTADISKYRDSGKTSGYAKTSVQWAIAKGIISGKDNGTRIDPQGTASRAEAASMIYNYCIKIK